MTTLMIWNGSLLMRNGNLAIGEDCCCDTCVGTYRWKGIYRKAAGATDFMWEADGSPNNDVLSSCCRPVLPNRLPNSLNELVCTSYGPCTGCQYYWNGSVWIKDPNYVWGNCAEFEIEDCECGSCTAPSGDPGAGAKVVINHCSTAPSDAGTIITCP